MKKYLIAIIIIAVAAIVVFWWWSKNKAETPIDSSADSEEINQDLNKVEVNDLDAEFNTIDQDLNNL